MTSEEDLEQICREAILNSMAFGEPTMVGVVKELLETNPGLKSRAKEIMPIVKNLLSKVASGELAAETGSTIPTSEAVTDATGRPSDYEELIQYVQSHVEELQALSKAVSFVGVYGSYPQKKHIAGESDINFLFVFKKTGKAQREKAIGELEALVNELRDQPLFAHLFNPTVLFEEDLKGDLRDSWPAFTPIHALSVKEGRVIIGENSFNGVSYDQASLQEAAATIAFAWIDELKMNLPKKIPEEQLADHMLFSAEIIMNVALALCYLGDKASRNF